MVTVVGSEARGPETPEGEESREGAPTRKQRRTQKQKLECGHRTWRIPMAESAAHKPTVHVDGGPEGRVMVADSLSFYEHDPWINDVAVGASFAGTPTAAMAMRQGVKAWIAHEAGPGKD